MAPERRDRGVERRVRERRQGFTRLGPASREASAEAGFARDKAASGGPLGKSAEVAAESDCVGQIQNFANLRGVASVLGSRELRLWCVAAGLGCS